jgi:trigger factor
MAFDAVFEVFPEVKIGDLSRCRSRKALRRSDRCAIDKTVDILRKQRRTFAQRAAWTPPPRTATA